MRTNVLLVLLALVASYASASECADGACGDSSDDMTGLLQSPSGAKLQTKADSELHTATARSVKPAVPTKADSKLQTATAHSVKPAVPTKADSKLQTATAHSVKPAVPTKADSLLQTAYNVNTKAFQDPEEAAAPAPPPAVHTAVAGITVIAVILAAAAYGAALVSHYATVKDLSKYLGEFIGTFLLVFTVGCCCVAGSSTWNATSIGAILMVSIYALGPISGGNFNPAVTTTLLLSGKIDKRTAAGYVGTQILAGLAAGVVVSKLFRTSVPLTPGAGFDWFDVLFVEVIYTAMLCFVVLNVAASSKSAPKEFFALAIGFVIIAGGYAAGGVSGACFNPAVSIGLDMSSTHDGAYWCFIYSFYQVLGAGLAHLLYRILRPEEFGGPDGVEPNMMMKCLSEFLGTFILVLTVGLNLSTKSPATAWSAAAALMCMIYAIASPYGAHFNPAVTLGVVLSGRKLCSMWEGLCFLASQATAGTLAGWLFAHYHAAGPASADSFKLGANDKYDWTQILVAELVFTFVLAYIVLSVATVKYTGSPSQLAFALAIGSCVTAGGLAIGSVSGGELNPAVALGIWQGGAVYEGADKGGTDITAFLLISLIELTGGALASGVFRLTHPDEYSDDKAHAITI
eukprot:gnl/TRDRNA2_/TRDRNA2_179240_c0_seq1.p1 gnl/TRDRNA2_/TRDRNA2_179240_c0~~gnl/TRDRNA2_/TRDRNA2_179240_c0_seq1.p1  ORF type:complete len:630 (+),score=130.85 gnl/TRDRNA2_/TRDRNA2_179240_c0_seq1:75-1964(+)